MTTLILNDRYDVTLAGPRKTAKGYEVEGKIWDRKSGKATDIRVRGEGRTISSAQDRARQQSQERCPLADE